MEWNNTKSSFGNDQDLVDSTESHRTVPWFEFDELVEFMKNSVAKIELMYSESDSDSGGVDFNVV